MEKVGPRVSQMHASQYQGKRDQDQLDAQSVRVPQLEVRCHRTATIEVTVPGAGELTLSGKDLAAQKRSAGRAGKVKLTVEAKGKANRKLKLKGKAKVKATITFTPAGGTSSSQDTSIKLVRKR